MKHHVSHGVLTWNKFHVTVFFSYIYSFVHLFYVNVGIYILGVLLWIPEGKLWVLVFSFFHVGSGNQTQVFWFEGKALLC